MNLTNFSPSNYNRQQVTTPTMTIKESGHIAFNMSATKLLWGKEPGEKYFQLSVNADTGALYIAPFEKPSKETFKCRVRDDHYGGCAIKSLVLDLIKQFNLAVGNGRKKSVGLEIEPKPVPVDNVDWYFIATK